MKLLPFQVQALKDWAKNEDKLLLKEDIVLVLKVAERPLIRDEIIERVRELREIRGPV